MINHPRILRSKKVVVGVYKQVVDDRLSLVAAGVAFYSFLSIFPALAILISAYGLIADPANISKTIELISRFVPVEVVDVVNRRLEDISESQSSSLTWGLLISSALSVWSASRAMMAVTQALNVAHETQEKRSFIKVNLITLALTLIASLMIIASILVIVFLPVVISTLLSNASLKWLTAIMSWNSLLVLLISIFLILYYHAPSLSRRPSIKSLFPGALFSTFCFLLSSSLFSLYVSNFGKYEEEYGVISAVVVTMFWLYIGSFIFLVGAELNIELRNLRSNNESSSRVRDADKSNQARAEASG